MVASSGRSSVTLPAWNPDDATWDELTGCVRGQLAAFAVDVVDRRPEAGSYIEVAFGGTGAELGLSGYASLAPIDATGCRLIDRAVVFVFAQGTSTRGACEAAVAGIGHAASLDHVMSCSEPLSYLGGCGDRAFTNEAHACGETAERPCLCDRDKQNSMEVLAAQLGRSDAFIPGGDPDACGELTYEGDCEEGVLSWCDEAGRPRELDCRDAGLVCGRVNDELGRDCKLDSDYEEDGCGDIDFLGVCSEDGVLTYCLNNQLQVIDCAASGLECAFLDDQIGNLCTVPPEEPVDNCGGIDFFGQCSDDGNVLSYCSAGELRVIDCAATGLVCGFESDEIGFDCIEPPVEEPPPEESTPDAGTP